MNTTRPTPVRRHRGRGGGSPAVANRGPARPCGSGHFQAGKHAGRVAGLPSPAGWGSTPPVRSTFQTLAGFSPVTGERQGDTAMSPKVSPANEARRP